MKKVNNVPIVIYVNDTMVMDQSQETDLIRALINQIKFAVYSKEPFIVVGVLIYPNHKLGGYVPTIVHLFHEDFVKRLSAVLPTLEEYEEYEMCGEIMKLLEILPKVKYKDIPKPGEDLSSIIHQL